MRGKNKRTNCKRNEDLLKSQQRRSRKAAQCVEISKNTPTSRLDSSSPTPKQKKFVDGHAGPGRLCGHIKLQSQQSQEAEQPCSSRRGTTKPLSVRSNLAQDRTGMSGSPLSSISITSGSPRRSSSSASSVSGSQPSSCRDSLETSELATMDLLVDLKNERQQRQFVRKNDPIFDFTNELRAWVLDNDVTENAVTDLLEMLKPYKKRLPSSHKDLMNPPKV